MSIGLEPGLEARVRHRGVSRKLRFQPARGSVAGACKARGSARRDLTANSGTHKALIDSASENRRATPVFRVIR